MTFTYEEAITESRKYFGNEELPANIVVSKYLLRDENDALVEKTPADKHRRLAKEFNRVEKKKFKKPYTEDEIYSWLENYGYIIPQGSPMYGIGNKSQYISVSNCFVVEPPVDSYGGIHKTDEQLTQISKRRGGVGTELSAIRPTNFPTRNSSRKSTGIIPFMQRFSNSIREVGQDGRRGALMLTLDVLHPQIEDFINCKRDKKMVTGANISTRVRDEFLLAVEAKEKYRQRWPIDGEAKFEQYVDAEKVWNAIIDAAWDNAEPGVLFWDNILRESPADCYSKFGFRTVSTNPCGELPLCALDSCRLLVLNLFKFVKNPFTRKAYFDYKEFYRFVQIAQRLMDDIIDLELECIDRIIDKIKHDPEEAEVKARELKLWKEVREKCFNGRRTGTGITALGDTIAALNIGYGSDESIKITEKIYQTLKFGAYRSSVDMAKELGAFPIWDKILEENNPFLNRIFDESLDLNTSPDSWFDTVDGEEIMSDMLRYGRRNIALLTTAPVGTVSNLVHLLDDIFGTTSGIEPAYSLDYDRFKKINPSDIGARVDRIDDMGDKWQKFTVYHPGIRAWQRITGKIDVKDSPYWGCCAQDLDWTQRVKLQAAAQKHVDHSISSTVNLPRDVSKEQVDKIFRTAWKSGLKGITIYRDGCRDGVLIEKKVSEHGHIVHNDAPKRPKQLKCDVHHIKIKGDKEFFVLVGLIDGEPYEVLAGENGIISKKAKYGTVTKIKRGQYKLLCDTGEILESVTEHSSDDEEAITRMVSTALRHGAQIEFIVHQLSKTSGHLTSFAKSLARALKKYIKDGKKVSGASCPDCGGDLKYSEGCASCACGYSKCS